MKKRIDLNGIELDRDYSTPKRFWNACKTVLKNHGIEIEDIFYTYEEWIEPSNPSIAHTNEDGSASENVSCRYHVYCPYRDEVDRGYNYILQYEDGHGYMYVLTGGYEMIEYEDENEKTENNKNEMESKTMEKTVKTVSAMERLSAMGFTIEPVTAEHVKRVKANMSTEKPEIIEISHFISVGNRQLKVCKLSATETEKTRIHNNNNVNYKIDLYSNGMIGGYDITVVFDTISGKTFDFVALSTADAWYTDFKYHKTTIVGNKTTSKADLIINSVNECETIVKNNTVPKLPKYAECTADRKKADAAAKTKKDYAKRIALNGTIADRKPEKLNEYSCNENTLITSIDYTNTDLKEIERLKNKWGKIGLSNDTFALLEKSKIESEVEKIKRKAVKRTDKNLVKHSNKNLKDVTDYAKEVKARNEELTKQAKSTTNRSEFIAYSKKFKKAFRNVVNEEYNENCRDVSVKLSALHEKQKALDEKRKQLKAKISACDSVISQLEKTDKNKINFSLIDSKLDIIGITLTDYSLSEIQAVKTSITTTLTNVNAKIGNILDDIKALTGINAAYSKIKSGKEIKIDVTTKSLDKNVYFSVTVGYDINNSNSTSAILHIRQLTEKTLKQIGLNECVIDVNYNIFRNSDPNIKLALARQITKRQAYNMIARQGSKTQYNIYHCAMRNDFEDNDTSDIYSVGYTQILNCLSVKKSADIVKAKKVIIAVNSKIQHLNKYNDCHVIDKYVSTANKALKDVYKIEFVKATSDYNRNKSVVILLENMHAAVIDKSVKALKTSCYNAINHYLTSIRAIREKSDVDSLDSVIESETDRFYTLFEDNQTVEYSEKSTILKMCYAEMKKGLNESALKVFELMGKGYSTTQIAEKKKVDKSAISHQIAEIKQAFLKCYADIKNSTENTHLFVNNPIVFDPSVFDDCKPISDKTEKIINTYNRNTEIDRIKNAVNSSSDTKENIKIEFEKYVKTKLRDIDIQIINILIDDTSVRDTAKTLKIDMNVVKRTKLKITSKIYELIEKHCNITVNKNDLKKVNLSVLFDIVKIA